MITENKLYNPADLPKKWLIEHFVVRTKVFEKIFKDIKHGEMKYPQQHYLIQGQRGMGKTTLLLRLKYEVENTPELNEWLIPIFFNEESYDLTSLSNLWEKTLKYLDDIWQTGGKFYKQTDAFVGSPDYERLCFDLLTEILHNENKKLIIFFDNFGQLFLDNLSDKEQHRLREILMHSADIRIVGASAVVLEDLHDYSKPFFEFFKIINLEGLNKDETFDLIEKLQEKSASQLDLSKNKAKIETLAILTGGVIRTVMLIYEVVLADQDGSALRDLETILDRITPLYKHRIEDLPVQQRKIVDVIAKKWDAISTKEIAENIRENGLPIATKLISAQLQQLEKNGVIEKKQTSSKNHLYQLKERFFNIWYLMRHGDRFDKCKVIWLTRFLELWYEDEKCFEGFIAKHLDNLKSGNYDPHSALLMADALSRSKKIGLKSQALIIKETSFILSEEDKGNLPDVQLELLKEGLKAFEDRNYKKTIEIFLKIHIPIDSVYFLLGIAYLECKNIDEAKKMLLKVTNKKSYYQLKFSINKEKEDFFNAKNCIEELQKIETDDTIKAIYNKEIGNLYYYLKNDPLKALDYYLEAFNHGQIEVVNEIVAAYKDLKDIHNFEKYCLTGIEFGQINLKKDLIYSYLMNDKSLDQASSMIEHAISEHPDDPDYNFLKVICGSLEKDSIEEYNKLLLILDLYENSEIKEFRFFELAISLLIEFYLDAKNTTTALLIINRFQNNPVLEYMELRHAFILLCNEQISQALVLIDNHFKENNLSDYEYELDDIQDIFLILITKKQFHYTYKLFQIEKLNLKDRLKPIYYALMYLMKDEYPNEYLKMGEELKQPVEDVLKKIEQMAIDYA